MGHNQLFLSSAQKKVMPHFPGFPFISLVLTPFKGSSDEPLKYDIHQGYVLASLLFSQYSFPLFNGYDS